ncbi:MAG TPA: ABC transporter ATP-binding protein [Synergistales bacterium]|jgi:branched-chain amino acid transport system ATP-binding protein|nr:ABC transporter ATP-binding protein [Synergistales bacterium]HRV71470.1 ABC transporter ATP-binding protein [Thermovirgaceae bacterium]
MALLEIRNVTMRFGSLVACNNVSFDVEKGSVVGLIGPNGAGKTTLFNCISGFYKPTSGNMFFRGEEVTSLPAYEIARRGAVRTFQVVHPLKEMTVLDNVLVGAFLRGADAETANRVARECISLCHLEEVSGQLAGGLTIGFKKRLEMARALATGPELLMLDEAMAGLTSTEIKAAVEILRNLKKRGITLLVVEHIMEAIMSVADKIVVLDGGEKISEGNPEDVVEDERVITAYLGAKFSQRLKRSKEVSQ